MKFAVVSNFVPDGWPLSEHAYHLVRGLKRSRSGHEVVVLSGRHAGGTSDGEIRHWEYGSPWIARQMLDGLRDIDPDAVLFNQHFTAWGSNLANFGALIAPLLASRRHRHVVTLLHHLPHTINAKLLGYRLTPLHRAAIELACHAIARAGTVLFTNARDHASFERYRPKRSTILPLGLQGDPDWQAWPGRERVLTFGNWGRSKDPRSVIEAATGSKRPYHLVVAGGSSHTRPGYIEGLRSEFGHHRRLTFTGYVPEASVPGLFHDSTLVVLPYSENTGVSSVLMQTCQYGRVPVLTRLPMFESLVQEHDIRAHFYDNDQELGQLLDDLLEQRGALEADGYHNYRMSQQITMPIITEQYWSVLEDQPPAPRIPAGGVPVAEPARLPAL